MGISVCVPHGAGALAERLRVHPRVENVSVCEAGCVLCWVQGDWRREIWVDDPGLEGGLVELCDNNPWVCADRVSVPGAASTLALIALGPLLRSGLLVEAPSLLWSFEDASHARVDDFLAQAGWGHGANHGFDLKDLGSVRSLVAMALVDLSEEFVDTLDDLYDEVYGRAFFVRRNELNPWDTALVQDRSHAVYRLSVTPGVPHSLLTVKVMADVHGKCGGAQIVHAFNVMVGFEESLGQE